MFKKMCCCEVDMQLTGYSLNWDKAGCYQIPEQKVSDKLGKCLLNIYFSVCISNLFGLNISCGGCSFSKIMGFSHKQSKATVFHFSHVLHPKLDHNGIFLLFIVDLLCQQQMLQSVVICAVSVTVFDRAICFQVSCFTFVYVVLMPDVMGKSFPQIGGGNDLSK